MGQLIAFRTVQGLGVILLTSSVCSLLLALSWGGTAYAWFSAPVLGLGLAAIGSFMALAVVELDGRQQPILPSGVTWAGWKFCLRGVGRFTEADALTISRTAGPFRRRTLENITVHGANRNAPRARRDRTHAIYAPDSRALPPWSVRKTYFITDRLGEGAAITTWPDRRRRGSGTSATSGIPLERHQPKRPGGFFLLPEWQNPGELAHEVNCEFPFLQHEPDHLDRRERSISAATPRAAPPY